MLEKTFRAALAREFRALGCAAVPIESAVTPGFPDLVVAKSLTALVELKTVSTARSARPFGALFEPAQRAFYRAWWKTCAANLWVAVYDKRGDRAYALQLHPDHLAMPISEVLCHHFSGTVRAVAKFIGGQI